MDCIKRENKARPRIRMSEENFPPKNKYNPSAWIIGEPDIGEGTWIGAFTVIDGSGGLKIGKGCDISCGAHIYTHSTVRRCVSGKRLNADGTVNRELIERKPVSIGEYTFIGPNATITLGVNIGKHCIVGGGAVVDKDVEDYTFVGGVPAKVIGKVIIEGEKVTIDKSEAERR